MKKIACALIVLFSAASCNANKTSWDGLTVETKTLESETRLIFRDGAKILLDFEGLRSLDKTGTLAVPGGSLFWAVGYSGGESGCCSVIHVFEHKQNTVTVESLERNAYGGSFEIVDLAPADGFGEIVSVSEEFYGKSYEGCGLAGGVHEGMSDLHVPEFWKPVTNKGFTLENVTFEPAYKAALESRLQGLAAKIEALPADLKAPNADIAALLAYAQTRKKAGLPADPKLARFRIQCEGKTIPLSRIPL